MSYSILVGVLSNQLLFLQMKKKTTNNVCNELTKDDVSKSKEALNEPTFKDCVSDIIDCDEIEEYNEFLHCFAEHFLIHDSAKMSASHLLTTLCSNASFFGHFRSHAHVHGSF